MSRIREKFAQLKRDTAKGFIPFVTAGDPNLDISREIVLKLAELRASVIELGVPFSDPMADGPTIQLSSQRALLNGVNIRNIFDLVSDVRKKTEVPIVLFSYLNPLFQFGLEKLRDEAARIGIDGILITDVIDVEANEISDMLAEKSLDLISLIAPTTSDQRIEKISSLSKGFIYAVSRAGVTGARSVSSSAAESLVTRARKYTDLPIAVGFGISTQSQIDDVWRYADAAVVGSAIVSEIAKSNDSSQTVQTVEAFVTSLLPQVAKSST
ncbi:MAG: tryptophan synthase subunit alpha [Acidobacteriota bacterium]|nr:tryptophan synthase subunit alpha [Acidobacteriota bacterium]